jgi:subtilase family serine protease
VGERHNLLTDPVDIDRPYASTHRLYLAAGHGRQYSHTQSHGSFRLPTGRRAAFRECEQADRPFRRTSQFVKKVTMNGGKRRPLQARALAAAAAVAVLGTGCVNSAPSSTKSTSTTPTSLPGVAVGDCLSTSLCYAPRQFRIAYGIQPLLDHGINGRGQTVVLLEFAAKPSAPPRAVSDIRHDLARFDSVFGLPAARLQVINRLARSHSPWLATLEEAEDTEIVHAVAPGATIREVLISDAANGSPAKASMDVSAALRLGMAQGAVISFSHSWGEQCFTKADVAQLNSALQSDATHDVTVVNSSGDIGASTNPCPGARTAFTGVKGVNLPGSDPLVLAAGGTSLQASHATGAYASETVWNTPPGQSPLGFSLSSAGGFSQVFSRPAYQGDVPGMGAGREVPDVSADADGNTGMALAITDRGQNYILTGASGTSAAAPLWAAVITLADQYAGRHLGFVNPAIYRIGRSAAYHSAFHDITSGTNTVESRSQTITGYRAGPGWDLVTGWGSPDAQALVPLLARYSNH